MSTKVSKGPMPVVAKNSFKDLASMATMPGRTFGLGKEAMADTHGTLGDAASNTKAWQDSTCCPVTNQQVIEYTTVRYQIPLLDTAISASFGTEVDLLQGPAVPAGAVSLDTSFAMGGLLQANMYTTALGVHITGSPMAFSTLVNFATAAAAATNPVSPDVFSVHDLASGGLGATTGITAGTFAWGVYDWLAGYAMTEAYQVNWKFCNRYLLLNEMLSDFAYFGPGADGQGFSDSEIPVQEFIAKQNNQVYGDAGAYMLPISHRRYASVNSITTGSVTFATNTPLYKPTNDFKLANVSWGGIGYQQRSCCQPFKKLGRPVYLRAGLPISITLLATDSYELSEMQRYLSISNGAGTDAVANVQIASGVTSGTQTGGGTAGLELTLDQGANQIAQQLTVSDSKLGKGGELSVSVLFKGFECCDSWLSVFNNPSNYAQLSQSIYMPGMSGVPAGR